jgi:hypothetical protein
MLRCLLSHIPQRFPFALTKTYQCDFAPHAQHFYLSWCTDPFLLSRQAVAILIEP